MSNSLLACVVPTVRSRRAPLALLLLSAGCASATAGIGGAADFSQPEVAVDLSIGTTPDLSCTLGTADHCGACNMPCPGSDDTGTQRTCDSGVCGMTCLGDFYDVDGDPANGCELDDPAQSTALTAVAVMLTDSAAADGTCTGTTNGCTVSRAIGSDMRQHQIAPAARPLGVDDWWVVTAVGAGTSNHMMACLSISDPAWPLDNRYQVCISTSGSMAATACTVAMPRAAGQCISPAGTPEAGTYYVRVTKTAGVPSALGYALYLEH